MRAQATNKLLRSYLTRKKRDPRTTLKNLATLLTCDLTPCQHFNKKHFRYIPSTDFLPCPIVRDPSALNGDAYRRHGHSKHIKTKATNRKELLNMKKRSLATKIIETDNFIELPATAQLLYLHSLMNADDDGVIDHIDTIARYCKADINDVDILVNQGYLIKISKSPAIYVITHWLVHNTIRKDCYKPSKHSDKLASLGIRDKVYYQR